MFNIFIKDPYAKRFQKDEKITKTSYIANSGGLLGKKGENRNRLR